MQVQDRRAVRGMGEERAGGLEREARDAQIGDHAIIRRAAFSVHANLAEL